jgi:hypothetical protein
MLTFTVVMGVVGRKSMKAIKKLLDECRRQGHDMFGFVHYIPKELIDDATTEYESLTREDAKRTRQGRIHKKVP